MDPVEPDKVWRQIKPEDQLMGILTTHHHWDHAGGNSAMVAKKNVPVYGGDERIEGITHLLKDNEPLHVRNPVIWELGSG